MPIYRYKHDAEPCSVGPYFEIEQAMRDESLAACPECGGAVHRVVLQFGIATPKTNSELKSMGFTKLVKRDDGVYENVTRSGKEAKYMEAGKADTIPHIGKKISD